MINEIEQKRICRTWSADFVPVLDSEKLGIAQNVRGGRQPINGLRHPPSNDSSGWYIWAGEELSEAEDFFVPLHIGHLDEWRPGISKYLGLAPGWRFLVAGGYEDVWFDPSLLDV